MANDPENVNPAPKIDDLPDQSISETPAGQSLEQAGASAVTLESILASPELQEYIQKEVQSKTDSRLGTYGTRLDTVEGAIEKYDSLVAGGMSKPQALAKMQGDQELQDIKAKLDSVLGGNVTAPSPGSGEKSWAEKQQAILDNSGIDKNDPRIVELLRTSKSKQEFIAELEEKSFAWKQADVNKPEPSATTVAQMTPSMPAGDGTWTPEKYKSDMLAAQGKPSEVRRIKAAARKDGVDVDNIGFGT